ncbi:Hypothetical predicted protein [Pelobates cultripes]|uniref:Uncharacterized protein n=1 Tax=Pelobates cultripes TaxID=61616 RepID=A0AAD1VX01_PELCU|nr:Hypothetical predicted protein [Pelobates cultripes]
MGPTKIPDGSQTPWSNPSRSQAGPVDWFLHSSAGMSREVTDQNMADSPTCSHNSKPGGLTLLDISADIRVPPSQIVTKEDLHALSDDIHGAIRSEVAMLRTKIAAHGGRLQELETAMHAITERAETSNLAVSNRETCCSP